MYGLCADRERPFLNLEKPRTNMKANTHPEYHPVVFVDSASGAEFLTYSTMKSDTVREIDGVDHHEIRMEITSDSHPFWTGTQKLVDTEGRVERFRRKYGRGKA